MANGFSVAAIFEGEFSDVTESYAGKGVVRLRLVVVEPHLSQWGRTVGTQCLDRQHRAHCWVALWAKPRSEADQGTVLAIAD
jgi:hypothetical protein